MLMRMHKTSIPRLRFVFVELYSRCGAPLHQWGLVLGNKLAPSFFVETIWHRRDASSSILMQPKNVVPGWARRSCWRASWECGKQQLLGKHQVCSRILIHTEVGFLNLPQSSNVQMGHVVGEHSRVIIHSEGGLTVIADRSNTVFSGLTAVWRVCPTLPCNI